MAALNAAVKEREAQAEAQQAPREGLASSLLRAAQPLLERAGGELVRKIRRPKKEPFPLAREALEAYQSSRRRRVLTRSDAE